MTESQPAQAPSPTTSTSDGGASTPGGAAQSVRQGLRGMAFAGQEAALTPRAPVQQVQKKKLPGPVQLEEMPGQKVVEGVDTETGDKTRLTSGEGTVETDAGGNTSQTNSYGTKIEDEDPKPMVEALKKQLEAEKKQLAQAAANLAGQTSDDPAKQQALDAQRADVATRAGVVDKALAEVAALPEDVNPATVRELGARAKVDVASQFKVAAADHTTHQVTSGGGNSSDTLTHMHGKDGEVVTDQTVTKQDSGVGVAITADGVAIDSELGRSSHDSRKIDKADGSSQSESRDASAKIDIAKGSAEAKVVSGNESVAADGSKVANSHEEVVGANLLEGKLESSEKVETINTDADGNASANSVSSKQGLAVGGGALKGSSAEVVETSNKNADGDTVYSASQTNETHGGLVYKDGETGATAGGSKELAATKGDAKKGQIGAKLTASADGAFTFGVVPVEGSDPPAYRITLTLHLEAAAGLGVDAKREAVPSADELGKQISASAGVAGSIEGSADLVFTRTLSADEALIQIAEADAVASGGAPGGSIPELSRLYQAIEAARAGGGAAISAAAIVGGPGAAAAMSDGDSVSLSLGVTAKGSAQGEVGVAGYGVGAEGAASATWERGMTMTRGKDASGKPTLTLTMTYTDKSTAEAGGSATIEGVEMGAKGSSGSSDGVSVSYLLYPDAPDFDALFDEIKAQGSPDEGKALAASAKMKGHVASQTVSYETSSGQEIEGGALGGSLKVGDSAKKSGSVTKSKTGLSGTAEGVHDSTVAISGGGAVLAQGGERSAASGSVAEGGATKLDLVTAEHGSNPLAATGEALGALPGMGADELAVAALEQSPIDRLKGLLTQEYEDLHGISLNDGELIEVRVRANDEDNWRRCCYVVDANTRRAWEGLRQTFRNPEPDPDEWDIDPKTADMLCLVRAVAAFVADYGRDAMHALERMLYRWGESDAGWSTATRLGAEFEWPSELAATKKGWDAALLEIDGLGERLVGMATTVAGEGKAKAKVASLRTTASTTEKAIQACDAFESESARSQMLAGIARARSDIAAAEAELKLKIDERVLAEERRAAADAKAASGLRDDESESGYDEAPALVYDNESDSGYDASLDEATDVELGMSMDPSMAGALEKVSALEALMGENKAREAAHITLIRGMLQQQQGGTLVAGTWDIVSEDEYEAIHQMSVLRKLLLSWIAEIKSLRAAYVTSNTVPSLWKVAPAGQKPKPGSEPDLETLADLYLSFNYGNSDGRKWSAQLLALAPY